MLTREVSTWSLKKPRLKTERKFKMEEDEKGGEWKERAKAECSKSCYNSLNLTLPCAERGKLMLTREVSTWRERQNHFSGTLEGEKKNRRKKRLLEVACYRFQRLRMEMVCQNHFHS
jgi:hypothetical protein